jgi:1,4-alpha-glucan branching enzyme
MLSADDVDALLRAAHGDPFAVLGPHADADGVWVRAFLPDALAVDVLGPAGTLAGKLGRIHEFGLFEGYVAGGRLPWAYRLRVHYAAGALVIDDPYRFASSVGELDRHLLGEGLHLRPWQVLGAHPITQDGVAGVRFCVWAPHASRVSVIGEFNLWDGRRHPMRLHPGVGLWEIFVPGLALGEPYKYELRSREGVVLEPRADPYAFASQLRPDTASLVAATPKRQVFEARVRGELDAPISIYEVHLGSWRRGPDHAFLDWETLASTLPDYVASLGFTHVELLPISEHPFDGSWGYQITGMHAPTRRFGDPAGLRLLAAACHARGLGVVLDWVPGHFPNDPHGLARFDGEALYEYADPREGLHRDWNTLVYDFARPQVRNYLISSALYWIECWGMDALRVDAVASMLYRDYSRGPGEWLPNARGGRENLEAISLLQEFNAVIREHAPGALTIAEESTAWSKVSRPTREGGLGFHYKWNMGWMHDTLAYMREQPKHRMYHHTRMNFAMSYHYYENFVLALSHDEVVHGKGSMILKMVGDTHERFANLRAYYAFMWMHPGKKLLFMGGEFAQIREWNHDRELDWQLLDPTHVDHEAHRGVQALIRTLNHLYRTIPALHELDCEEGGFAWIEPDDAERSVLAFVRMGRASRDMVRHVPPPRSRRADERLDGAALSSDALEAEPLDGEPEPDSALEGEVEVLTRTSEPPLEHLSDCVLVVCNFSDRIHAGYRVGLPAPGAWSLRLASDAREFGGPEASVLGERSELFVTAPVPAHGQPHSLELDLPPLTTLVWVPE